MKKLGYILVVALTLGFVACNNNNPDSSSSSTETDTSANTGDDEGDFVELQTWNSTVSVVWDGTTVTVSNLVDGVEVTSNSDGYLVLTSTAKHIIYAVSGSGTGQLKIYSDYKFQLQLNTLTLTCSNGPAINNQCGKSCYLVLSGTNTLSDGSSYASSDEDQKAALFSEGQLLVSGNGTLTVTGNYKHAVASDDYVRLREGTLTLLATVSDGLHANDGIIINGGSLSINAAGDAIQCDTSSIVITDGVIDVIAAGDKGLLAYSNIEISGGTVNVKSVDKGIKSAAGNIVISDGIISVTTTGDDGKGILAKLGEVQISGGTISVTTSGSDAKGIKAVGNLTISDGDICVVCSGGSSAMHAPGGGPGGNSGGGPGGNNGGGPGGNENSGNSSAPEGIESKAILTISGGKVFAQSSDDAINSASDMVISGGYVCAYSTGNDGLDANGNCYIKGGTVYAIGTSSPEVGIDANTEEGYKLYVQGGNLVAIGGIESGSSLSQSCYQASTWSSNTWYALYDGSSLVMAFKTPSSGGSGMIISTSSTPSLTSDVTLAEGTPIFNGMALLSPSVSNGSSVTLSAYSGGNAGGGFGGR